MASRKNPALPAKTQAGDVPSATEAEAGATFPIVGIGASAGGLAAFEAFFSAMPPDINPGMAFVLVQHLAPDHKSILSELVKRYTRMQVSEVEDGIVVQPNSVYIIPPNRDMALSNGRLLLMEPAFPRGQRLPIDYFFRSLAREKKQQAICIVLSGTGSDGTLGVRAVKEEGGMVMVQSPETSEFDGMPRSAIATGLVDHVLPPAAMQAQLSVHVANAPRRKKRPASSKAARDADLLQKIALVLRAQTGHDFSLYKQSTISRRVERRMAVHRIERLEDYVQYLQQSSDEVVDLFNDLLIGVTNFFRDPESFVVLAEEGIPRLFAEKPAGATIRIWTCGCSSGEEAYSLAILLQEKMDATRLNFKLQIFATDIDGRAVEKARSGIYPRSISSNVSPERLARFFVPEADGSGYRITKGIRDLLIFSRHDITKDPPFSKIDLISCRNLLIYMGGELQKKMIPLFHYALNPGGILFLGTSESTGDFADLFAPLDRLSKLYLRKENVSSHQRLRLDGFPQTVPAPIVRQHGKSLETGKLSPQELIERLLVQKYTPVSALINKRGDIIYLHGRSGRYLELACGNAGVNNILTTAREGLRYDLTTALHRAAVHKETVSCPGLLVKTNGDFTRVNLTVEPVADELDSKTDPNLFLVVLQDAPQSGLQEMETVAAGADSKWYKLPAAGVKIAVLKKELEAKEEYLKSTIEELETTNEDLKSSNEEMQSVNEELQSTNEELETSKEELQSVNEELSTVNAELQSKVTELSQVNNDMNNLLAGTGVGTIFVDHQLCVQRFTPAVTAVINLIRSDVGRPLGHIVSNLVGYNSLVEDVEEVLATLNSKELEVQSSIGDWFLLCIRPYRTLENVIEGAVITFTEMNETVNARAAVERLAVVVHDSFDAISVQGLDGQILAWNPAAEKMFGWSEKEALGMKNRDRIPEPFREKAEADIRQLCLSEALEPCHTQRLTRDGRIVDVWLTASVLMNKAGQVYAIATTERGCLAEGQIPPL